MYALTTVDNNTDGKCNLFEMPMSKLKQQTKEKLNIKNIEKIIVLKITWKKIKMFTYNNKIEKLKMETNIKNNFTTVSSLALDTRIQITNNKNNSSKTLFLHCTDVSEWFLVNFGD